MTDVEAMAVRGECPECRVRVGYRHKDDCPQSRCEADGLTWLHCPKQRDPSEEADWDDPGYIHDDDQLPPHRPDVYVGVWAMERDCRRLGWFVRWDEQRMEFVRCHPAEPGAGPDITRLTEDGLWDWRNARWIRRKAVVYVREQTDAAAKMIEGRMRAWADELGYEVVYVGVDVVRQAGGFRAILAALSDPDRKAEVVLIRSQKQLGSSNDVRRRAVQKIRETGGNMLTHELWADVTAKPHSYADAARLNAVEQMGADADE